MDLVDDNSFIMTDIDFHDVLAVHVNKICRTTFSYSYLWAECISLNILFKLLERLNALGNLQIKSFSLIVRSVLISTADRMWTDNFDSSSKYLKFFPFSFTTDLKYTDMLDILIHQIVDMDYFSVTLPILQKTIFVTKFDWTKLNFYCVQCCYKSYLFLRFIVSLFEIVLSY